LVLYTASPRQTPEITRRCKPSGDVNNVSPSNEDARLRSRSGDSGNETDSSETSMEKSSTRSGKYYQSSLFCEYGAISADVQIT